MLDHLILKITARCPDITGMRRVSYLLCNDRHQWSDADIKDAIARQQHPTVAIRCDRETFEAHRFGKKDGYDAGDFATIIASAFNACADGYEISHALTAGMYFDDRAPKHRDAAKVDLIVARPLYLELVAMHAGNRGMRFKAA